MSITIAKAIEILAIYDSEKVVTSLPEFHDAVALGVEALQRLQELRYKGYAETQVRLPGETEK